MGNVFTRMSAEAKPTKPDPPPVIVRTGDGHELEYLGKDRGLYCFRLRNFVQEGRYVGDFTSQLDCILNNTGVKVFFLLKFGAQLENPGSLEFVTCFLAGYNTETDKLTLHQRIRLVEESDPIVELLKSKWATKVVSRNEILVAMKARNTLVVTIDPPPPPTEEKSPSHFAKNTPHGTYIPMTNVHCPDDDDDEEDNEGDRRNSF